MGRHRRSELQTGWFHVMNRGVDRGTTFFADVDRVEFGRLLGVGHQRFGVDVHAYCLMTNHFHLLVHCPDGGLSEFMHVLTSTHARHVNDRLGRDGPLYRGRFTSQLVADDRYVMSATRYIHRNALDLPGVDAVERYRWSSHRAYLGLRRSPDWLRTDVVLGLFGADVGAFHAFVSDNAPAQVVGMGGTIDVARLAGAVRLVVDEADGTGERAPQGLERTVMLLAVGDLEPTGGALTSSLGLIDRKRTRDAISRARRRARAHPELHDLAHRALRLAA